MMIAPTTKRTDRLPNLVQTLYPCYHPPFWIVMRITTAVLGAGLPFLLLHFRCSTPVLGYRFPIPHSPFPIPDFSYIQMKVLFAWLRILCISKIIVRKLPLNSIYESFEEGRLKAIFAVMNTTWAVVKRRPEKKNNNKKKKNRPVQAWSFLFFFLFFFQAFFSQ